MNVIIDGVRINRITEIKCNVDTDYTTHIHFHIDDRLKDTTDPKSIKSFGVFEHKSKDENEIDYAVIIIPNKEWINLNITNDNKR